MLKSSLLGGIPNVLNYAKIDPVGSQAHRRTEAGKGVEESICGCVVGLAFVANCISHTRKRREEVERLL